MQLSTGNIDLDREVLLKLSDRDFLNTCHLNKYYFKSVCNDLLFKRRLQQSYPTVLQYYDEKLYKNYKKFFLEVIRSIYEMQEGIGPRDLKYTYLGIGNPIQQRKILATSYNLLISAAKEGDLELVKFAIRDGTHSGNMSEALIAASYAGHLKIVKYLYDNGIDEYGQRVNIHQDDDLAIRWASEKGHLEIVKFLVEKGADVHAKNNEALRMAEKNKHFEVAKFLKSLP